MYTVTLVVHSLLRWIVLVLGAVACARSIAGWRSKGGYSPSDARVGLFFSIALDLQLLIGLLLYFALSPITKAAMQNMAATMHNPSARFFAVEHLTLGILAVVAVHVTRIVSRKGAYGAAKHKRSAIGFLITVALLLITTPWPFLAHGTGRPWFRM